MPDQLTVLDPKCRYAAGIPGGLLHRVIREAGWSSIVVVQRSSPVSRSTACTEAKVSPK
jgi:hypothetical protein